MHRPVPRAPADHAYAAPHTHGVLADVLALPLRAGSVTRLVCNEVLADLPSVPARSPHSEVAARVRQNGLQVQEHGWYNPGAWMLLEDLAPVMTPGGRAVLTEFGTADGPVQQAVQLDHPEVGIHFGQLTQVAQSLGFETQCMPLAELLGLEPGAQWLSRPSWLALRARAAALGVRLPARAWTPQTLTDAFPFAAEHLLWAPCTSPGPGPDMSWFYALVLRQR